MNKREQPIFEKVRMPMDIQTKNVGEKNKKLREGYTTGTCAAAAAQGAVIFAFSEAMPKSSKILTPKGKRLELMLLESKRGYTENGEVYAVCAVKKDSGDDPDVTNGVLVYAKVTLEPQKEKGIFLMAGLGVGTVTKPGLACAVGQPAINPTPRRMIEQEIEKVAEEFEYSGRISVEISIPKGIEIAKRTYNPRLGIVGGISVLGTSGIVEPMSEQALIDTIKVEINMQKAAGARYLVITPGNYGETFLKNTMKLGELYTVKCSNFLGEALDYAEESGFDGLLLVGHIGKFVKVAGGIFNTHSKYGDARLEIMSAHAALKGASQKTIKRLMNCLTTDDAISVLDEVQLREQTIESILEKLDYHIKERTHKSIQIGAVTFSNQYGYLGQTKDAAKLIERL